MSSALCSPAAASASASASGFASAAAAAALRLSDARDEARDTETAGDMASADKGGVDVPEGDRYVDASPAVRYDEALLLLAMAEARRVTSGTLAAAGGVSASRDAPMEARSGVRSEGMREVVCRRYRLALPVISLMPTYKTTAARDKG